jgi:hypothetical protein
VDLVNQRKNNFKIIFRRRKGKEMKKIIFCLLVVVLIGAVSDSWAVIHLDDCAYSNSNPNPQVIRGPRGLRGPMGPAGPAAEIPLWVYWLAGGAVGLSLLALGLAIGVLSRNTNQPIVVNNFPPSQQDRRP